jgi:hypothetical protein
VLPFLKPKAVAGLIIAQRKPDGTKEELHSEGNEDAGLEACAEDLIRSIHSKDAKGVMEAMKAAFQLMELQPHEEVDHDEDGSYESQNIKAAR